MTATDKVVKRFDLSESDAVPGTYPVAVAVSKDGTRGFVALWNASEVVELDLVNGKVGRRLALLKPNDPVRPGTHPCALEISPDGKTLYVALANRDAVAAVDISGAGAAAKFAVKGYFDTRLAGQSYFGAEPVALAVSADGKTLYVANMGSDAVAVIDTRKLTAAAAKQGMVEPVGFIPTEWMPMSVAMTAGKLYVATDKGRGTGPNNFAQKVTATAIPKTKQEFTYIATLLYGSLAAVDVGAVDLKAATAEVMTANRMRAAAERIEFAAFTKTTAGSFDELRTGSSASPSLRSGSAQDDKQNIGDDKQSNRDDKQGAGPIKHVIYIIKENRTYDQIFGDLKQNGRPVGNGDAGLAMYGESVTPNQHKLALQFGVLDNFFDSGEVSGDGHEWSNAAISTDYNEKTWQQQYRNAQRTYDYEGVVADGYPLLQKIADVNEPASGYMWGNAEAHGRTHYNFGEFISSTFCDMKKSGSMQEGPLLESVKCAREAIQQGEAIPAEWGGGVSKWPWAIPLLAGNVATKPELVGHFAAETPDFNLRVPDQIRAEVFLRHFAGWVPGAGGGEGHHAELHHGAAERRPYGGDDGGRADAEGFGGGQRPGGGTRGGCGVALGVLGRHGDLHFGGRCAERRGPRGRAPQYCAGGEQVCAEGEGRRGVCGQPVLYDGERGADDGDAAGAASDEQQRCAGAADGADVCGAGRPEAVCGGLREPGEWADLHGECEDGGGSAGVGEDGLYARGPGGCEQAECNLVAGRDGRSGGAGAVDRKAEEGEAG